MGHLVLATREKDVWQDKLSERDGGGGGDAALPFNINQGSRNRYSPLEATAILSPAIPLPLCLG